MLPDWKIYVIASAGFSVKAAGLITTSIDSPDAKVTVTSISSSGFSRAAFAIFSCYAAFFSSFYLFNRSSRSSVYSSSSWSNAVSSTAGSFGSSSISSAQALTSCLSVIRISLSSFSPLWLLKVILNLNSPKWSYFYGSSVHLPSTSSHSKKSSVSP